MFPRGRGAYGVRMSWIGNKRKYRRVLTLIDDADGWNVNISRRLATTDDGGGGGDGEQRTAHSSGSRSRLMAFESVC